MDQSAVYPWLWCAHRTKQEDLLLAGRRCSLLKTVSFSSYAPLQQKMGTLIGTWSRVDCNTYYAPDVVKAVLLRRWELLLEDWSEGMIVESVSRMCEKVGGHWELVLAFLLTLSRFLEGYISLIIW